MDRRTFLQATSGAVAGGYLSFGCASTDAAGAPAGALERIGVQLYTVRDLMGQDAVATLETVAAIGYQEVEFAGYFGHSPRALRTTLDGVGLRAPAAHVPIEALRERLETTIEAADVLGHHSLVLAWIAPDRRRSLDDYRRVADEFNHIGSACREADIQFVYHNHDFEFGPMDGVVPYDLLLQECDADLVKLEMDLFWITRGGADPLAYFERHPGRFPMCHVKDMDANGGMVDVGGGTIDFAPIFAQSDRAGLRHYFVEHDQPGDSQASIAASFEHLRTLTF